MLKTPYEFAKYKGVASYAASKTMWDWRIQVLRVSDAFGHLPLKLLSKL